MYWQRRQPGGGNNPVFKRADKVELDSVRLPSIKNQAEPSNIDAQDEPRNTLRNGRQVPQHQSQKIRMNSLQLSPRQKESYQMDRNKGRIERSSSLAPTASNTLGLPFTTHAHPQVSSQSAGGTLITLANDNTQLKHQLLKLEMENETLQVTSDSIKHKHDTLESELAYYKRIIAQGGTDIGDEMKRELLLRETEDRRFALQQSLKSISQQYEDRIVNLNEEKNIEIRENRLLRREFADKQDLEPASKRISELVNLVDDLKMIIAQKNTEKDKLLYKIDLLQNRVGILPVSQLMQQQSLDTAQTAQFLDSNLRRLSLSAVDLKNGGNSTQKTEGGNPSSARGSSSNESSAKTRELEGALINKNKEIQQLEGKNKRLQTQVSEAFKLIREYYKETLTDESVLKKIETRVALQQSIQEKNPLEGSQLSDVLKELFARKQGLDFTVKQEIDMTSRKMNELANEMDRQHTNSSDEIARLTKECKLAGDRLKESNSLLVTLDQQLSTERSQRMHAQSECEQLRADFTKKVRELTQDISKVATSTDLEVNKLKIGNFQSLEQNKQLIQLVTNKETEITQLRLRLVQYEEELTQTRRKNVNSVSRNASQSLAPLQSQNHLQQQPSNLDRIRKSFGRSLSIANDGLPQAQMHSSPRGLVSPPLILGRNGGGVATGNGIGSTMPIMVAPGRMDNGLPIIQIDQHEKSSNNLEASKLGLTNRMKSTIKQQQQQIPNMDRITVVNPQQQPSKLNAVESTTNSLNASTSNPFMKIRYIRSLKEWAVYWKYYQENPSGRAQLLEKMMQTETLREEFTNSEELKPRVFCDSLEGGDAPLAELATIIMADTIDLERLSKEEVKAVGHGREIVRNLRPIRGDEDLMDYHNLQISALKVLSYMDNSGIEWSEVMSDELMNVNGLKSLVQYAKQDAKQWPKLLSLNVLNMIARKKALINFMVSYDIQQPLMLSIDSENAEIQKATLALLVPLLPEEQFINSISDIKYLLKLIPLLMQDNNTILSNVIQCIVGIIPTFAFQKLLYKSEIIERIAQIASTSPYTTTRIHALNLFKKLIEFANEKECELVNIQGSGLILRNLEIAEGETLREMTPLREVLYRSLMIIRSLIEDFPCPDEHLLSQRIMRLLSDPRLKNDNKSEQGVLEIIHILWDKMEGVIVTSLHDREVLRSIVEGYLRGTTLQDGVNYGLMLVGVCEKKTLNGYIIDLKGRELLARVISNCHHLDYKTAITAAKLLVFLVQETRALEILQDQPDDLRDISKLLAKQETQEPFISCSLEIVFHCMRNPECLRQLIDFDVVEETFQLMDEQLYSIAVMVQCFQCLELVHTLHTQREKLKEICIDDEVSGSDVIHGIENMCLIKISKDIGQSSLFFWRFIAKHSAGNDLAPVVYQRADEIISVFIKLKRSYNSITPDLSTCVETILQNLSLKSADLKAIIDKHEKQI